MSINTGSEICEKPWSVQHVPAHLSLQLLHLLLKGVYAPLCTLKLCFLVLKDVHLHAPATVKSQ